MKKSRKNKRVLSFRHHTRNTVTEWHTKNDALICTPEYHCKLFISAQRFWTINLSIKPDSQINSTIFEAKSGLKLSSKSAIFRLPRLGLRSGTSIGPACLPNQPFLSSSIIFPTAPFSLLTKEPTALHSYNFAFLISSTIAASKLSGLLVLDHLSS